MALHWYTQHISLHLWHSLRISFPQCLNNIYTQKTRKNKLNSFFFFLISFLKRLVKGDISLAIDGKGFTRGPQLLWRDHKSRSIARISLKSAIDQGRVAGRERDRQREGETKGKAESAQRKPKREGERVLPEPASSATTNGFATCAKRRKMLEIIGKFVWKLAYAAAN